MNLFNYDVIKYPPEDEKKLQDVRAIITRKSLSWIGLLTSIISVLIVIFLIPLAMNPQNAAETQYPFFIVVFIILAIVGAVGFVALGQFFNTTKCPKCLRIWPESVKAGERCPYCNYGPIQEEDVRESA
jgi:uncharacterized integral membrane protein